MLAKAKEEWDQEQVDKLSEKDRYLAERITPLSTSGLSLSQLQVCFELGSSSLFGSEEKRAGAPGMVGGPFCSLLCRLKQG